MAFFGVTREKIATVKKHPNADRLDVCTLEEMSFQFVTGRGDHKIGDTVLYFPLDALVPIEVLREMGFTKKTDEGEIGTLSGKDHNRITTMRLRGEISQGIVADLTLLEGLHLNVNIPNTKEDKEKETKIITQYLGVTKYEPPEILMQNAKLVALPTGQGVYDIEGADRYVNVLNTILDQKVWISEKLEGQNFSVTYVGLENKICVNQRNYSIVPDAATKNTMWKVAERQNLIKHAKSLAGTQRTVVIYGELCGPKIQNNKYKLKEHTAFIFDIKIDGRFVSVLKFMEITEELGIPTNTIVPNLGFDVTLSEWLDGATVQTASNGRSRILQEQAREGIVIKPMVEQYSTELGGRLILKQRSPEYLI
jgi:RNA ligase (TIGR02306 family)